MRNTFPDVIVRYPIEKRAVQESKNSRKQIIAENQLSSCAMIVNLLINNTMVDTRCRERFVTLSNWRERQCIDEQIQHRWTSCKALDTRSGKNIYQIAHVKVAEKNELSAVLFKHSRELLFETLQHTLLKIWEKEELSASWIEAESLICNLHKKGHTVECFNCQRITLSNSAYKLRMLEECFDDEY